MADVPFPVSESEIFQWLTTMSLKLPIHQAALGVTNAEIQRITDDRDNFGYLISASEAIEDTKDAFFEYKRTIFTGNQNTPLPAPSQFAAIALPANGSVGIVPFAKGVWKRSKNAAGYTQQIGEDMGWVVADGLEVDPDTLTAALKCSAKAASAVELTFSKQGQDAMRVEFKRKGDADWQLAGVYTSSPATHDVPSTPPDEPESRQYRGVLVKKNANIGNFSPIYTVVTTP